MTRLRPDNLLITAILIFCAAVPLFSQQGKVIELRSADRMEGKTINNEPVRELTGNVHFVQIDSDGKLVHVWCDRAIRFMNQNKVELYGNVKIVRDSVTLRSKEGVYYGDLKYMEGRYGVQLDRGKTHLTSQNGEYYIDEKRSHFIGNVVLVDTSSMITCNDMNYYEAETRSVARDNVHVFDFNSNINIYGDSLVHIEQQKFTIVMKQPRMLKIDTSTSGMIDTMVVISRVMQSFKDSSERFVATDSVQMVKGNLSSRCGTATYYVKEDFIDLETHPIIWSGDSQITGDSIRIFMRDNKLYSLRVRHRAMAVSRVDSTLPNRFNQLTGRELTMYFRDNKLDQVDVRKNATSWYCLFDMNKPNGANKSSGDHIIIYFADEQVDQIKVIGGVEGEYFPEKMIYNREQNYNLDGFKLYENKPIRKGVYIISK
jgi:lipopolysaccharide export system protein LptA